MAKNGLPPVFSCTSCASGVARSASQRSASAIRLSEVVAGQAAPETISCTRRARPPDRIELAHQRMRGADLVVSIGADQQQVPHVRIASADLRADRAWPRRAIADRRGRAPADAPAARTRR